MKTVTEIVTRRFLLRDFTDAERPVFLAYQADPRLLAFHGPDEAGPEQAERLFDLFREWATEEPRRNYQLAILRREEPTLLGTGGVRGAGCEPGQAELGIELAPDFWGRHGYAIEAGRALLAFGFGELGLEEIRGRTVSANARVQRLAEWFGAEVVAAHEGNPWMAERGWNEIEWRISRERWERTAGRRTSSTP